MIEGPRLRLRALEPRDLPRVVAYSQNPEVTEHLVNFRLPRAEAETRRFVDEMLASEADQVFSIETRRGRYLGSLGFHDISWIDRCCEFGLLIADRQAWGRGLAAEAVRLGLRLGFERLNLHRLEVPVLARNKIARAMYERLGFEAEARLRQRRFVDGAYQDVIMLAYLAVDYDVDELQAALQRAARAGRPGARKRQQKPAAARRTRR